jgi:hypothetical protein
VRQAGGENHSPTEAHHAGEDRQGSLHISVAGSLMQLAFHDSALSRIVAASLS